MESMKPSILFLCEWTKDGFFSKMERRVTFAVGYLLIMVFFDEVKLLFDFLFLEESLIIIHERRILILLFRI
jgi:hypothetical protein